MAQKQNQLEKAIARLVLLAEVQGMTIDDLIAMMESGASVSDIVIALSPHQRLCA